MASSHAKGMCEHCSVTSLGDITYISVAGLGDDYDEILMLVTRMYLLFKEDLEPSISIHSCTLSPSHVFTQGLLF